MKQNPHFYPHGMDSTVRTEASKKVRKKLDADIQAYLGNGGKIKKIPTGVSTDRGSGFRGNKNKTKSITYV